MSKNLKEPKNIYAGPMDVNNSVGIGLGWGLGGASGAGKAIKVDQL